MAKQRDSFENEVSRRVGAHVRELREYLGLTREHLADELGCAVRTVKAYEEGTRRVTLADAVRLSSYFRIDLNRLVNGRSGPALVLPRASMSDIGRIERPQVKPPIKIVPKAGD